MSDATFGRPQRHPCVTCPPIVSQSSDPVNDRFGDQSLDAIAGSLRGLFDFDREIDRGERLLLDLQTGQPIC